MLKHQRLDERKSLNNKVFENFLQKEKEKKAIIEKICEIRPIKRTTNKIITLSGVKDNRKNEHRAKAGLSPQPHDEKKLRMEPTMGYIRSPKVHTFTELKQKRIDKN